MMDIDKLDVIAFVGLALIGLGFYLDGYPLAIAVVGVVCVIAGVIPHVRRGPK
jgi:hypothetical protein